MDSSRALQADDIEECHHDLAVRVDLFQLAVEPLLDFPTFLVGLAIVMVFDSLTKFAAHIPRLKRMPLTFRTALVVHGVRGAAEQRQIVAVEAACSTSWLAAACAR